MQTAAWAFMDCSKLVSWKASEFVYTRSNETRKKTVMEEKGP